VWQHIQGAMGFFDIRLTTNFSTNLLVNFFLNRLRFDRIRAMSLWLHCRPIRFVGLVLFVIIGLSGARCPEVLGAMQDWLITNSLFLVHFTLNYFTFSLVKQQLKRIGEQRELMLSEIFENLDHDVLGLK